jgi:hypothetical protein
MTSPESLVPIVPASPSARSFVAPFDTVLSACLIPAIDGCGLPVAAAIARLTGARLVAACALSEPSAEPDGEIRHAACDAHALLGRALALPPGPRAKAIVHLAHEEPADLVALAAPGDRGSDRIPTSPERSSTTTSRFSLCRQGIIVHGDPLASGSATTAAALATRPWRSLAGSAAPSRDLTSRTSTTPPQRRGSPTARRSRRDAEP